MSSRLQSPFTIIIWNKTNGMYSKLQMFVILVVDGIESETSPFVFNGR